ncbi:tail fiber domain-containing protein [Dyadobacter sp. 676]|uniref:Tail fiber domain-containing protein n=1 Tax=Dyadobacter sp. 676 TaxID=3088362 RepID=A0AAU8FHV1_9BACT
MKTNQLLSTISLAAFTALSTASMAQVKIGSNPTTITPGANLDVEGQNSSHTVVMQSGNVGINHPNPPTTLHVQAVSNLDLPSAANVVARFDPVGGSNIDSAASIAINAGRAVVGFAIDAEQSKYAFLRGNSTTDLRLQVIDANQVLQEDAFVISTLGSSTGFIGINNEAPQSRLDVRGDIKAVANPGAQTGNIWNGTSNVSGFEVRTTAAGDAWVGIQRAGSVSPLHVSKPAGTTSGEMINFAVGGNGVGAITHTTTNVQYNTTSDQRLKENIRATKFGLEALKAVKVYDYNYKKDPAKTLSTGVLAQELHAVYPQAVTVGGADAKTAPWQVDYSKLVPMLIQSLQELDKEVESLKNEKAQLSAELKRKEAAYAGFNNRLSQLERALNGGEDAKSVSR